MMIAERLGATKPASYDSCPEPQGKTAEEDPARLEAKGFWQSFVEAVKEEAALAWDGARELCIDFIVHSRWAFFCIERDRRRPEIPDHGFLRYNPIWWLCVFSMAVLLVPGHWTHKLFGQGGPVRPDEVTAEKRARVGWVYTYTGGFVCTLLLDAFGLVWCLVRAPEDATIKSSIMSVIISAWYIWGNVHLLYRMQTKDTDLMHAMVINRITFGVAMLVVFMIGWLFTLGRHAYQDSFPKWTKVTWVFRLTFVAFMLVAYIGYAPLLALSYDDPMFVQKNIFQESESHDNDNARPYWTTTKLLLLAVFGPVILMLCSLPFLVYGPSPFLAFIFVPIVTLLVALVMEDGTGLSARMLQIVITAMFPCIVIFIGFMVAGTDLWEWLAGK